MAQAAELLAAEEAERHRRVVLLIDEKAPICSALTSWRRSVC